MANPKGILRIKFDDAGNIKTDGRMLEGEEEELLEMLGDVAEEVGGERKALVVEKHVHKHGQGHGHSHSHGDKVHSH